MENRKKTFGISAGMGGGRAGTVKMAVCISAFLLSLLCSLIYNAWKYDRISLAEDVYKRQSYTADQLSGEGIVVKRGKKNFRKVVM